MSNSVAESVSFDEGRNDVPPIWRLLLYVKYCLISY